MTSDGETHKRSAQPRRPPEHGFSPVLLVDDCQSQCFEHDSIADERMRAHQDVHRSLGCFSENALVDSIMQLLVVHNANRSCFEVQGEARQTASMPHLRLPFTPSLSKSSNAAFLIEKAWSFQQPPPEPV
jgi:hypothetical protein